MKDESKKKQIGDAIKRLREEKRAVREYIQKHGTLDGFKNESIKFVRPF